MSIERPLNANVDTIKTAVTVELCGIPENAFMITWTAFRNVGNIISVQRENISNVMHSGSAKYTVLIFIPAIL